MNITWALMAFLIWGLVMVASLVGALIVCAKQSRRGVACAIQILVGAVLLFGFVSGIIGLYEISNYARTLPFWISMGVGIGGLWLTITGWKKLKRNLQ